MIMGVYNLLWIGPLRIVGDSSHLSIVCGEDPTEKWEAENKIAGTKQRDLKVRQIGYCLLARIVFEA